MVPPPPRPPTAFVITRGRCPGPLANIVRVWVYDAPHGAGNFGGGCVVNEDLRCYPVRSELACRAIIHRTPPDGESRARSQARPARGERPRRDHAGTTRWWLPLSLMPVAWTSRGLP